MSFRVEISGFYWRRGTSLLAWRIMRNFFTAFFGSLAALILFVVGCFMFGIVLLVMIASSNQAEPKANLENNSYIVFRLNTNVTDAPAAMDFSEFTGGETRSIQLRTLCRALSAAAKDSRISGVLITGSFQPDGYGSSFAALKEVRASLLEIRKAGKPIIAYLTDADTRDYFVASAASHIALDPYGMIFLPGLAARPTFFTGTFEKYGIGVQVTRVGKYKSAVEPFIRKNLSEENREQLGTLLGDLWKDLGTDMATSRKIKVAELQAQVDSDPMLRGPIALKSKLVDRLAYRDEIIEELKEKTGRKGSRESFKQISINDYARLVASPMPALAAFSKEPRIAVVYAEGDIVDGDGEHGQVGGTRFARELRKLRQDDSVKAIVLRVNSPGGSASASETIQRELRLTRKVKPVVVSMGAYAASGGYWISAYSERIFAESTTITGSIGVFGLYMDVEKLAGSVGLSFDTVKTGRFADAMTITRPKTDEELAVMQRFVDAIYDDFVSKVADARKIDKAKVQEIAQGRVWSGATALKLGLVDELGGLEDAI